MNSKTLFFVFSNLLSICLLGQYPDFKFDREVIKNENIHSVTIFEIHAQDSIFHSEYFFDKNGNISTRIFSQISHEEKKFQRSFHRDSFSYDLKNHIKKEYSFHTSKLIKYNPKKHYKIPKKVLKKLKKAKWILNEGSKTYQFNKQGNLLSLNSNYHEGKIINLSKYHYGFNENNKIIKKFYFDQSSNLVLTDSIIYLPNSSIEYQVFENRVVSKVVNNFFKDGSYECIFYSLKDNNFHPWRTFNYNRLGEMISDNNGGKHLTKYIYHENGLLNKIEEGLIQYGKLNEILFLKYEKRKGLK